MTDTPQDSIRVDKWLWYARFFKSRSLATKTVSEGGLRLNGDLMNKPSRTVSPGDVLTFPKGKSIYVVRVVALGSRRGPAAEATLLYENLTPDQPKQPRKGARPTKKDRREAEKIRKRPLE